MITMSDAIYVAITLLLVFGIGYFLGWMSGRERR